MCDASALHITLCPKYLSFATVVYRQIKAHHPAEDWCKELNDPGDSRVGTVRRLPSQKVSPDFCTPSSHNCRHDEMVCAEQGKQDAASRALIGLLVHSAADGFAVGASSVSTSASLSFLVAVAMVLHKVRRGLQPSLNWPVLALDVFLCSPATAMELA